MTEDDMVGWHHQLNRHGFEQALGAVDGQGSLACFSPWGCKELDITQGLNNNNKHTSNVAEKATAPHSSTLAWRIPWTEEPEGLQSMGPRRAGHD